MNLSIATGYLIGVGVGLIVGIFLRRARKVDGILKVDVTDPKRDKYLMEFHIPLDEIPMRKYVNLRVINIVDDSQNFSGL